MSIQETNLGRKMQKISFFVNDRFIDVKDWIFRYQQASRTFDEFIREKGYILDKEKTIKDMIDTRYQLGFGYKEYFLYQFFSLSAEQRKEFISAKEQPYICDSMNQAKNKILFDDKWKTYNIFEKYYKRDMIKITGWGSENEFKIFIKKHNRAMVKPCIGACGFGIRIIDTKSQDEKILFQQLLKDYQHGCVMEELIVQDPEMMKLHPSSVNTVRVITVRFDDRIEVIHPYLRVGLGDSVVDNTGRGGIIGLIDTETGVIFYAGDESGNCFELHPDTGEPILGFCVPQWEAAKAKAKELAMVLPGNRYTGWDLALTEKGWVMIEGNTRPAFVFQIPQRQGFRREINAIFKEMHIEQKR